MKKVLLAVIPALFSVVYGQQNISIKEGPAGTGLSLGSFLGEDNSSFYTYYPGSYVEKYNKSSLTKEYTASYNVEGEIKKEKRYDFLDFEVGLIDGEITMVYEMWNKSSDKRTVYVKTIDKAGKVSPTRKEILTCQNTQPYRVYQIFFSKDKTKFLVNDKKTTIIYDTKTVASISSHSSAQDYNGVEVSDLRLKDILKNNDIAITFSTGTLKERNLRTYSGIIRGSDGKIADVKETTVILSDNEYRYSNEEITTADNMLVMGGMYIEKVANYDKKHPPELKQGTYLAIVDPVTRKPVSESYNLLEKDVYDKLTYKVGDDDGKHMTPGEKSISSRKLIQMNGSFYVVCEHSYELLISTGNSSKSFSCHRELLVSKYNSKGKFEWMRIIPKFDYDAGAYDFMNKDGVLYFFYLDNKKDFDKDLLIYDPKEIHQTRLHEGIMTCTTIDEAGNMKKVAMPYPSDPKNVYKPMNYDIFLKEGNDLLIQYIDEGGRLAVISIN